MGGRGGSSGIGAIRSKDGAISNGSKRKIVASRSAEVLEAKTDNYGNLTFVKAVPTRGADGSYEYRLKAGAVDGKPFGVDLSKANSINGKTYSLKEAAKSAGMKWNGERWSRGFQKTPAQSKTEAALREKAKKSGISIETKNAPDGAVLVKATYKGKSRVSMIMSDGKIKNSANRSF